MTAAALIGASALTRWLSSHGLIVNLAERVPIYRGNCRLRWANSKRH